jgi:signal transduction histidine kinase
MSIPVRRGHALRTGVILGVGVLAALLDLGVLNVRSPSGRVLLAEAAVMAVIACQVGRGGNRRTTALGLLAAAASVLTTHYVSGTVLQRTPGVVALLGLLLVLIVFCRRLPPRWLVFALPVVVALGYLTQRLPAELFPGLPGDSFTLLAVLLLASVVGGFLLRSGDMALRAAREHVRREERLELARDLHDHVAHYVTAMVVAAQAGEQLAERDPATARELFGRVERTGQDGLVAMSRMVRLLRTAEKAPRTVSTLGTIRDQVERFSEHDIPAQLHIGPGIDAADWPPELGRSVERLVQEGLTNVRKHARAATAVQVSIEPDGSRLVVRVRDDGSRAARSRHRPSGFGLVGLAERVTALGGEFTHGPHEGGGWQLSASLPGPAGGRP